MDDKEIKKREIRFLIRKDIYDELVEEAEKFDVPLASFIKVNIEHWRTNGRKRKESI